MASVGDFLKNQAKNFVDQGVSKILNKSLGLGQGVDTPSAGIGKGFNVQSMIGTLSKSGFAKASHFEVWINGKGGDPNDEREMAMRVDVADIPGRNFAPIDHKFTNIGPVNRMPHGMQTFTDVTISVILSEDLREKLYFERWQEAIRNTGAFEGAPNSAADGTNMVTNEDIGAAPVNTEYGLSPFYHNYFDNYIGTVEIRQYGVAGELMSIHTLVEAYPISIAPISMSWASEEAARMQVTFAYRYYKTMFNRKDQPGMGSGFSFNLGKNGFSAGLKLPGIGSFSVGPSGVTGNFNPLKKTLFKSIGL